MAMESKLGLMEPIMKETLNLETRKGKVHCSLPMGLSMKGGSHRILSMDGVSISGLMERFMRVSGT